MNFLIVIGGPTAAGKTALAIRLAKHFHAEIVSADSRQFYREMSIGTAKPDADELAAVHHHLIDSLSIQEDYDIGQFEQDAIKVLEQCYTRHNIAILVGGSGLYLDAVISGIDELPGRDPAIRQELENKLKEQGIEPLQQDLKQIDPDGANSIDLNNPHRLIRAIELCRLTGKSLKEIRTGKTQSRNFHPILLAVSPEREQLYKRIDARVIQMMEKGLLSEVKSLWDFRSLNALKTVGYSELFDYLEDKMPLDEAIKKIQQHTRNYAKRQLTWFRNRNDFTWFAPGEDDHIIRFVTAAIVTR